jgi:RNA polymerase sigma-70 factor (ECF subfamily)
VRESVLKKSAAMGHAARAASFERVNQSRLREVVSLHFDGLWRFLRRIGVAECDVDDAIQEIILVLARRLEDVAVGCERSFLLSTAVRVASGLRRTHRNRREVDADGLAELPSAELDPEAVAQQLRLRRALQRVLNEIPLELRAVFVLYELEELTMSEIAQTLALPPGTVASRLRRSRELFQSLAAASARELGE